MLDARLQILDRQIQDVHGVPAGTVDDIALDGFSAGEDIPRGTPPPVVTALVSGPVWATRIFGGRPSESRLTYLDLGAVETLGSVVRLRVGAETVDSTWLERLLSRAVAAGPNHPMAPPRNLSCGLG